MEPNDSPQTQVENIGLSDVGTTMLLVLACLIPAKVGMSMLPGTPILLPMGMIGLFWLTMYWHLFCRWGTMFKSGIQLVLTHGRGAKVDLLLLTSAALLLTPYVLSFPLLGSWFVLQPRGSLGNEALTLVGVFCVLLLTTSVFRYGTIVLAIGWGSRSDRGTTGPHDAPAEDVPMAPSATDLFSDLDLEGRSHG